MSLGIQATQLNLLIRADASAQIGTGHIMRCLALAQAWQVEGNEVMFLMGTCAPDLESRLRSEGCAVTHHEELLGSRTDGDRTIALAQDLKTEIVVVDGYHFGAAYQLQLKQAGLRVLFIDDNGHAEHYYSDWVLNQNIYAHAGLYPHKASYTQLLLGTRYALLRKEFWPWRDWQREFAPSPHKILVTLGGSDPNNVTLKVIQALQQLETDTLEVVVVVGASNPHYEKLQGAIKTGKHQIELQSNVINMPELMAWADMAITAGGSTCWELAFMQLPSLVITIAENQIETVKHLHSKGCFLHVGWHENISVNTIARQIYILRRKQEYRHQLSLSARDMINTQGLAHLLKALQTNRI